MITGSSRIDRAADTDLTEDETFEVMADACIAAGEAVMTHGTPELREAMRALLRILGQEIVRREAEQGKALSGRSSP